ncbi:porin Omp33-36 [Acinetobacter pollinis]|uniref:porin Omp33-36 n=2 Tax=Gammaproteobacteria TaxID=1236 RepID=UPI0018A29DCC|nr:porin Omp33-36 [Acinetobacter pollinis]MBF7691346.1 porin Omp33-36 [Acinetobacter pollinis]MBF7694089.1 porin Omp33-36 [Acinetobacter pollinis]MBF7699025.1 porin Omp33-36 [Acinetobacter pollinis]MBF7699900.1 porin Omp33-36 [Acinetobacter pollinis]
MKKIGLATAVLLAMTGAHAYQVELQGQSEYINSKGFENSYTGDGQGTFYFKDVDASKGPLAEAAFLNKASNVQVGYHFDRQKEFNNTSTSEKTQSYGAKAEGYYDTSYIPMPVYGSASYTHTDVTSKEQGDKDKDRGDRYALEVGVLPTNNFLVAVGYTNVTNAYSLDNFKAFNNGVLTARNEANTANARYKTDAVTARAKYVGNIDNTNMAVGFEVDSIFVRGSAAYGLATDLYLTPKLSVGATYADTSAFDSGTDHIWGGNVNYFITPAISVGATYTKANAKNYRVVDSNLAQDAQTIGLNTRVRF